MKDDINPVVERDAEPSKPLVGTPTSSGGGAKVADTLAINHQHSTKDNNNYDSKKELAIPSTSKLEPLTPVPQKGKPVDGDDVPQQARPLRFTKANQGLHMTPQRKPGNKINMSPDARYGDLLRTNPN